jgi:hypothetical protein
MADKKGSKKEATSDDIMTPAEMKPILARAKHGDPASCVICLTKDKDGVILLDKRKKPKQLVSLLKKAAAAAGLELENPSIRFGKATITEDEAGLVNFVVNKEASGAMRPKLLALLKKAGYQKVEISVDEGLEDESEEDDAQEEQPQQAAAPAAAPPAAAPVAATPAATQQEASPAPPEDAMPALKKRLAGLMQHIPEVLAQAPDQKDSLIKLATTASAALKAADVAATTAAEDALEKALTAAEEAASKHAADASAGRSAAAATISKTGLAWVATRKAVEGQIDALHKKMTDAYKDHGFGADLDKYFKSKVEPVLDTLDESLVEVLKEASAATGAAEQKKLMADAQKIIGKYENYLASESLIKQLDKNPFQELKIEETLTKTLATLSKTLTSIAGSINV